MSDWEPESGGGSTSPHEPTYHDTSAEKWYEQRGPLAAAIAVGLAVVFFLVALLVWWLNTGGDDEITTGDVTTTIATTTTVPVTQPPATQPPVTEPAVTEPAGTEPPATQPPVTEPAVTDPPVTLPPPTTTTSVPVVTIPPSPDATVWDIVSSSPDLSRLRQLLIDAELDDVIDGEDPFTLFAPGNDAFDLLEASPGGAALLADQGRTTLLLLRHLVFPEIYLAEELLELDEVLVATGELLVIDADQQSVDGARLTVIDIVGSNGVLHVVERVLVP